MKFNSLAVSITVLALTFSCTLSMPAPGLLSGIFSSEQNGYGLGSGLGNGLGGNFGSGLESLSGLESNLLGLGSSRQAVSSAYGYPNERGVEGGNFVYSSRPTNYQSQVVSSPIFG
ncbi:hypothetical protein BY996DRAFT_7193082, partial [Phakopsora pachyrhizi]